MKEGERENGGLKRGTGSAFSGNEVHYFISQMKLMRPLRDLFLLIGQSPREM